MLHVHVMQPDCADRLTGLAQADHEVVERLALDAPKTIEPAFFRDQRERRIHRQEARDPVVIEPASEGGTSDRSAARRKTRVPRTTGSGSFEGSEAWFMCASLDGRNRTSVRFVPETGRNGIIRRPIQPPGGMPRVSATGLSQDVDEYRRRLSEQPDEQIDAWAGELMRTCRSGAVCCR